MSDSEGRLGHGRYKSMSSSFDKKVGNKFELQKERELKLYRVRDLG